MPSESRFEIAHVLCMDVVGYSQMLIDDQREVIQELKEIVRATEEFRAAESQGKLISLPTGDGMVLAFFYHTRCTGALRGGARARVERSAADRSADGCA